MNDEFLLPNHWHNFAKSDFYGSTAEKVPLRNYSHSMEAGGLVEMS